MTAEHLIFKKKENKLIEETVVHGGYFCFIVIAVNKKIFKKVHRCRF